MTIDEIKARNEAAGQHFFEAGAISFFSSRIGNKVYEGPGGIFFVTSEQFKPSRGIPGPRRYTVRKFTPETGNVATFGEFNKLTSARAHRMAEALANGASYVHA